MNELSQIAGRFHPLLVHLPVGVLLLALAFEALSRKKRWQTLQPAVPFILLTGACAAAFACLTGWLLSRYGEYETDLADQHQWLGIGVAIVSFSAYWLKTTRRRAAYIVASVLLLPGILLTTHWGISLTQGEGYLVRSGVREEKDLEKPALSPDIPDVQVSPPAAEAVAALQNEGVIVLPIGKEQPALLSLNFVNVPKITPAIRQSVQRIQDNIIWLKMSEKTLNDSTLAMIAGCENLTRLSLDRSDITDAGLAFVQQSERLVFLNLVGTKVTAQGIAMLSGLPNLRQVYLYQTGITPADTAALRLQFPKAKIDFGDYRVPVLPADTTMLPLTKK